MTKKILLLRRSPANINGIPLIVRIQYDRDPTD